MIFWLGIYLLTIVASGFAAVSLLFGGTKRRLIEIVALSAAFGLGIVPAVLFFFSMFGFVPSRAGVLGILLLAIILIVIRRKKLPAIDKPLLPRLQRLDAISLPGILLGMLALTVILIASLALPPYELDAVAIWGLKARVLLTSFSLIDFLDRSLSFSHLDYPLLLPMLFAGAFGSIGGIDEMATKILSLLTSVTLIGLLYAVVRSHLTRSMALLLTCIAIGWPAMTRWAGQAEADVPLALFILGCGACLFRWLRDGNPSDAIAAGLFAGFAGFTKLEGIVVVVAVTLVIIITWMLRRDRRSTVGSIACLLTCAIVIGPWLIWSRGLPQTHENYASRIGFDQLRTGLSRIPELFDLLRNQLVQWSWWTILLIAIIAIAQGWRRFTRREFLSIGFIFALQLAAYLWAYLVTPWDLSTLAPMTASRLMLQVTPLLLFLSAACAGNENAT